jgi:hypothetical protein
MYEPLAFMFGARVHWTMEPENPESPTLDDGEEYGGNSINDPNPSGNPDEDS